MNRIVKIVPLMFSLVVLASCGGTSGSGESSATEPASSVEEPSSQSSMVDTSSVLPTQLTQDLIDEYMSGYAIEGHITETYDLGDGYVYDLYYAFSAECTEEGYHYRQGNYSEDGSVGFEVGTLYEGNFEPYSLNNRIYVSDWALLLDNTVAYSIYNSQNILWEDTFDNFMAYMDVQDFTETSTGVWSYDLSANTYMSGLIYSQMYGYWGSSVTEFDLYVENGEISGYHAEIADSDYSSSYGFTLGTSYDGKFVASGSSLYERVSPKEGNTIDALETAFASLKGGNYTVNQNIMIYDYTTNSYVEYVSNDLKRDGTNVESSLDSYSLPSFDISSVLFTEEEGKYSLDVDGAFYADTTTFDPFTYYADIFDELTIEIDNDSNTIVFTACDNMYGLIFILTYSDIGTTVISAE